MKILIAAALGLAPIAAWAHPGHGLENGLLHTLDHGVETLWLAGGAVCLIALLAYQVRRRT